MMLLKSSSDTPLWGSDSRLMTSGRMLYTALPCMHTQDGARVVYIRMYKDRGLHTYICMYRDRGLCMYRGRDMYCVVYEQGLGACMYCIHTYVQDRDKGHMYMLCIDRDT